MENVDFEEAKAGKAHTFITHAQVPRNRQTGTINPIGRSASSLSPVQRFIDGGHKCNDNVDDMTTYAGVFLSGYILKLRVRGVVVVQPGDRERQ